MSSRPAKKQRTEKSAEAALEVVPPPPEHVVRQDLLAPDSVASLQAQVKSSSPYPHVVLDLPFDDASLRRVKKEIEENIAATFKETDLFTMRQTGDFANFDKLDEKEKKKLEYVRKLRDELYSPEFRQFISSVLGCGPLSEQTDCACNIHPRGGHLLCHDDVIGTRRVSYIIYLTDPDDPWTVKDGGLLELYPRLKDAKSGEELPEPDVVPATTVVPKWNHMAIFTVDPGHSFHSIQEVFAKEEKPRMSIQGWFHADSVPEHAELATRLRLLEDKDEDGGIMHAFANGLRPTEASGDLDEADLAFVGKFLNPSYLSPTNWARVAHKFRSDGSVQLRSFLSKELAGKIAAAMNAADEADGLGGKGKMAVPLYNAGVGGPWEAVGPAHKRRHLVWNSSKVRGEGGEKPAEPAVANGKHDAASASDPARPLPPSEKAIAAGALLSEVANELFASGPFARFLTTITTLALANKHAVSVRRFRPGLDYTVAHHGLLAPRPRLDAVLCFVNDTDRRDKETWESGDVGGFEAYLPIEDETSGTAAEYKSGQADSEDDVLNVPASFNTLDLVMRDSRTVRFVKYLSARAPSSRWDVAGIYEPEEDDAEDGEGEKGEGEVE